MKEETASKKDKVTKGILLDPDRKSPRAAEFEDKLLAQIVGQERAVRRMSGLFQIYLAGMNNPSRPIGTLLFLRSAFSGKHTRRILTFAFERIDTCCVRKISGEVFLQCPAKHIAPRFKFRHSYFRYLGMR